MILNKHYTLHEILKFIQCDYKIYGNENVSINKVCSFFQPRECALTFIERKYISHQNVIYNQSANLIICDRAFTISEERLGNKCLITVNNPKLVFSRILKNITNNATDRCVHPNAVIDKTVKLGKNIHIGPNTIIEKNCTIGNNTIIKGNCYIFEGVKVGKNVIINPGSMIGKEGFGYIQDEQLKYINFPHIGSVVIEDDVEIGCNVAIDRGALSTTRIGNGTKIDDLVHIAHNVQVGSHSLIASHCTVAGSAEIGDHVYIGPGVTIRDGVTVEDKSKISMGSAVVRNVVKETTVSGYFAVDHAKFLKIHAKTYK
jgi:UDP-3-O-[3-hydroxymyristoyl] glucosamine N-acyltransferase